MGRPARPLHDVGNHRADTPMIHHQLARRGTLIKQARANITVTVSASYTTLGIASMDPWTHLGIDAVEGRSHHQPPKLYWLH